ncbi:MAG: hypothetical protein F6J89_12865 [Symploca sp. SIO1C4]|uniref:Uncharacterized protein n=1 Tax=Symploca sp. SIO1C4 TaxID=2607765 RepID=A0A6B3NA73_9CYAN|nr:hypothetical protein [Symploca sp. SIO1C4]
MVALAAVTQQATPATVFKNLVSTHTTTHLLAKNDDLETEDDFQADSQKSREVRGSGRLRSKIG